MSVRIFAPAKINLTLKVARPRADGMHPLQSVVAFADVGDMVEATPSDGLSLKVVGDFADQIGPDDDNLVLRAARALGEAAGRRANANLTLEKNLPVASGIGGGSADAAATLRALNDLWGLNWSNAQLAEVGARLGSDVPVFFTRASAAYMTGAGETCAPFHLWPMPGVLINPLKPLATPDVFRAFDQMRLGSDLTDDAPPEWDGEDEAIAAMRMLGNDLEPAARALMPEIGDILTDLAASEHVRHAALSGSGATVFAIAHDWDGAETLADELIDRHPAWWIAEATLGA
ncbi:MAG TPA: 4-(cytidine 5'-diphospho)-2-C-methyl-D-erythritol kinase [Vitreimonas sp.]|uniref:4-(cytidine 5'-diphospho)-2-C-methyl-D-erythritol kinase n=1 Tax=Vitreimonas sp. TaxID=3069702 RepID=UPI002D3E49AC|nr:4-(cytidine 5'-diphospho)-2-C-methyl-D-erythritol kinase [Vitreimonas sp.]HYD86463.1 4-(cytidine 5'-diphospho)-2-C-methyl-D-erythritol kinase [Vitreimonas sp.]